MTKVTSTFIVAFGFFAASLAAAVPAFAGPLNITKPAVTADSSADLHLVDRGGWRQKGHFKKFKKHFRGYDNYGDSHYRGRGYGKKRFKHAYRRGYDEGYYRGHRDSGYRGYDRYQRPRYRRRGHRDHYDHDGYRGGGYFRTPGIYFRF